MIYAAMYIPLLASMSILSTIYLSQPPANLKPKIFVIGLSKTGTTSVGDALALLGYKRLGWKDIWSRHLVCIFLNDDIDAVVDQTRYYDAFEDLPWPYMYRQMAEMYPDAKFVLSLRKDDQTWLKSIERHMERGIWQPAARFYGAYAVKGNEDTVLNAYRAHTENVRHYFRDKSDRYVELVVDDGDVNWNKLCSIAKCPEGCVPTIGFPKSNTAAHWHDDNKVISFFRWIWNWSVTSIENLTSYYYYQRSSPLMKIILEKACGLVSVFDLVFSHLHFKLVIEGRKPLPVALAREDVRERPKNGIHADT